MTDKEKIIAYDNVVNKLRKFMQQGVEPLITSNDVQDFFPELAESKDEQHRKWILEYLYDGLRKSDEQFKDQFRCAIAWLEKQVDKPSSQSEFKVGDFVKDTNHHKQPIYKIVSIYKECYICESDDVTLGDKAVMHFAFDNPYLRLVEQKPVDKVEPKFKVGNWYQCTKDFFGKGVTFDKNTAYYCAKEGCLQNEYGCHIAIVKDLYDNFKLWTIQDARDGDVLYSPCCKLLFIFKNNKECYVGNNLNYHAESIVINSPICVPTDSIPTTKEQRELLFQKMHEAGYEWDVDKKEPIKIESQQAEIQKWSEEDEDNLTDTCVAIRKFYHRNNGAQDLIDWLKSLKERVTWKPSDKQIIALRWVLNNIPYSTHKEEISGLLDQIKDL